MPPTSTTPDDFFYILKVVLNRLLSSSSLKTLHKTIQQMKDIVARDYASVIQKRLEDVYKHTNASASIAQKERYDREQKSLFIVSLFITVLFCVIFRFGGLSCLPLGIFE